METWSKPLQTPGSTASVHISEPELDMRRAAPVQTRTWERLLVAIRKLISDSRKVALPMRSIARELEESWPAGEG